MQVRSVCHKVSGQVCRGMLLQFLGNILCEGVVVQQSADCEILQGILREIKILPHAHTDIGHSFSVFIFNVYQFCLCLLYTSIAGFANDSNFKFRGLGIQSLEIFEKCQVDILGNISVVRHENRQEFH